MSAGHLAARAGGWGAAPRPGGLAASLLLGLLLCACPSVCAAERAPLASVQKQSADAAAAAPLLPVVEVTEHGGVERRNWPVSVGVPFPRGQVADGEPLQVVAEGNSIPSQARTLAHWPDGSVRWALVDFETDLPVRQQVRLQVRPGRPPAARQPITVKETGEGIEVDTGAVRFEVPKKEFGILHRVAVGGHPFPMQPLRAFIESAGGRAVASAPHDVTVDEPGPVRVQVSLRGRYENGFEYRIRLQAYAGQAFVRILHTFINATDQAYAIVDQIGLELPVTLGAAAAYGAGRDGGSPITGAVPDSGIEISQPDNEFFTVNHDRQAGRLSGWFTAAGTEAAVGLDVPFWWQEYPQAVRIAATGITYDLWSRAGGAAKVGIGAAKTHEALLVLARPERVELLTQAPGRGVTAAVDPEWTARTGALRNAVSPSRNRSFVDKVQAGFDRYVRTNDRERWDDSGQVRCPPGQRERPRTGAYGMFNWGDWNYPDYHDTTKGCDAWGNQEYDLTQVMALLFAASGRADAREYLTAAARHFVDVDRVHHVFGTPGRQTGMNHPKNPLHFSFELGSVDLGHTWIEGLLSYYFLTGDEIAREGALEIADYLVSRLREELKGNPRQFGWPALALAAAYEATNDVRYRQAALEYARLGMRQHPRDGAKKHWKMGVLAEALSYVHAVTGDASVRSWLTAYAAAVMKGKPRDVRFFPAVAYAGRLSADAPMQAAARAAADGIAVGGWGKPLTVGARAGFRIYAILDGH